MSVSAQLCGEICPRTLGQIRRHDERGATIEGKRRDQHAPVPNRDQFRHAVSRLLLEELDWIWSRVSCDKFCMGLKGNLPTNRLAVSRTSSSIVGRASKSIRTHAQIWSSERRLALTRAG